MAAFQKILRDAGIPAFVRRPRGRDIYAACGQLKRTVEDATLPELPDPIDFFPLRRDDGDFDADGGPHVAVLPPENPSMVLLQDALTRAQSQTGESFRGIEIGRGVAESLVPGCRRGWHRRCG